MLKGSNNVALGYDEGSILIKVCWLKLLLLLLLLFSCIHFMSISLLGGQTVIRDGSSS